MGNRDVKMNKLRTTVALVLSGVVLAFSNTAAFAATSGTSSVSNNNQKLRITPVKTDITINPGETATVKIGLSSLSDQPMTLQAIENDFVAGGESGQPALILDPNSYAPSHSLKRFMVPLQSVTIPAKGTASATLTITVPKSAQAGGYFGAVRFSPTVGQASGGAAVALGESVASLILLTVPGPTTEQLTLTDFSLQQSGNTASSFRTGKNIDLFMRFQNKGNLQESPFGQINVQKGKKAIYSYNFNQDSPKSEILPDSGRVWKIPLKGFGNFGKYTISGTFSYGAKGQTIEISKTVWIIPTVYIIIVVVIVSLLLLLGGGSYVFLKSYKRKILKSSRRRY
jgi:hypothetical protein